MVRPAALILILAAALSFEASSARAQTPEADAVAYIAAPTPVFLLQRPHAPRPFGPEVRPGGFANFGEDRNEGARLASQYELQDPAVDLARAAAEAFAAGRGLGVQAAPPPSAKAAARARYVVQVSTTRWGLYGFANWGGFRLLYSARLRITGAANGATIAQGSCGPGDIKAPDLRWPDFVQNRAAELKAELAAVADECLAKWRAGPLKG